MPYLAETDLPETQMEEAYQRLLDQARLLLPLDTLAVVLIESVRYSSKVVFSWKSEDTSGSNPLARTQIPIFHETPKMPNLNLPIQGNYDILGSILMSTSLPDGFSSRESLLAADIIKQFAIHLENVQLYHQIQTSEQRNRVLSAVNHILESTEDLDALFGSLVGNLCTEIDIDQALLAWITSNGYEIDTLISNPKTTAAVSHSSIGKFADPFPHNLNIPLSYKKETIGSFQLSRATCPFSTHDRELLQLIGNHIAPAVYNQGLHNLTMQQAYQLTQQASRMTSTAEEDDNTVRPGQAKMDDLAHALYSPLTSIKGYTDTLLQPGHPWSEEVNQEFLQTINQAADRLDHAIRDLLIPTTTKHQKAKGRSRQTCVQDLFRQSELVLAASSCPVQVDFQCDVNLPKISIDPYLFDRVLGYLIDCSISATTAPDSLLVLAQAGQDSAVVSLGFSNTPLLEGQPTSATNISLDTDLRVIASQKLLREEDIDLDIERLDEFLVLLRFAVPFRQTGA